MCTLTVHKCSCIFLRNCKGILELQWASWTILLIPESSPKYNRLLLPSGHYAHSWNAKTVVLYFLNSFIAGWLACYKIHSFQVNCMFYENYVVVIADHHKLNNLKQFKFIICEPLQTIQLFGLAWSSTSFCCLKWSLSSLKVKDLQRLVFTR